MAPTPYAEVLARNIRAARSRIDLGQDAVAARMRNLGFSAWLRQTVGSTERGRRRPTAEEILGLAFALETTVPRLMAPLWEDKWVELPSGMSVRVGAVVDRVGGITAHDSVPNDISWHENTPVRTIIPPHEAAQQERHDAQPVVAAIVTSDLGVLVGRRNDGKPPWTFIAGEQDVVRDDRPENTAAREVKEETGLLVQAGDVIGERVHPKTGRRMIYIAATPTHGTDIFVGDEEELAEVRWVSLAEADELLPGMFEPVREHLARVLGRMGG
jgi:8-oxo-dGTP diphosphatase